jgi:hypothetical protein
MREQQRNKQTNKQQQKPKTTHSPTSGPGTMSTSWLLSNVLSKVAISICRGAAKESDPAANWSPKKAPKFDSLWPAKEMLEVLEAGDAGK